MFPLIHSIRAAVLLGVVATLAACGSGGGSDGGAPGSPPVASSYSIGGTVSGLTGAGLTLNLNGSDSLAIAANGRFTFATRLATGARYAAAIVNQPSGQICVASDVAGTVASSDIASVTVTCAVTTPPSGTADPIALPSGNPSSADLIKAALNAGTITAEQAIVYEMYADFADPRLPAQLKGDDTARVEGHAFEKAATYISNVGESNVSAATLDLLRPFITPPQYVGSYWQSAAGAAGRVKGMSGSAPGVAALSTNPWISVAGTNVVVWYREGNAAQDAARAVRLANEFDTRIWPTLTALMRRQPKSDLGSGGLLASGVGWTETDGRLDVYLDEDLGGVRGRTVPVAWSGKTTAVRILVNRTLPDYGVSAVAAHEFMHAIQYSYNLAAASLTDYHTTMEATAAWASHFVYPLVAWESSYAQHYLTAGNVTISYDEKTASDLFRYGAYLFPLFLENTFSADIVRVIWEEAQKVDQELLAIDAAITQVAPSQTFADVWPKFVANCWNQNGLGFFTQFGVIDHPALTEGKLVALSGGFDAAKHLDPLQPRPAVPRASMAFYRVSFAAAPDARSVTFVNGLTFKSDRRTATTGDMMQFTGLSADERHGASLQIFLKVNGAWFARQHDFTNVPFATVCRDDPAGKIDEAIFMYGNGEVHPGTTHYDGLVVKATPPGMIATDIGCRDWTGDISLAVNTSTPEDVYSESIQIPDLRLHTDMPTAVPPPADTAVPYPLVAGAIMPAGYGYLYSIVGGVATWNYSDVTSNCRTTGSASFPIANPFQPLHSFTHWTAPTSTAFHGLALNGLTRNLPDSVLSNLVLTQVCTEPDGKVTTRTFRGAVGVDLVIGTEQTSVRITGGGLTVRGNGIPGVATSSGAWEFTGATK